MHNWNIRRFIKKMWNTKCEYIFIYIKMNLSRLKYKIDIYIEKIKFETENCKKIKTNKITNNTNRR